MLTNPESFTSSPVAKRKKHIQDVALYVKRRASKKKKSESTIAEAIETIKQIATQPIFLPQSDQHTQDALDHFTAYVGAKLREMSPQRRMRLEEEIMRILFTAS